MCLDKVAQDVSASLGTEGSHDGWAHLSCMASELADCLLRAAELIEDMDSLVDVGLGDLAQAIDEGICPVMSIVSGIAEIMKVQKEEGQ